MSAEATGSLELEVALTRVGGDHELLQEIAQLFLDDCPQVLKEIRASLESQAAQRLESAAHGLKGSVGNFGARAVVEAALELENMGRAGNLDPAPAALARLEAALTILQRDLRSLQS